MSSHILPEVTDVCDEVAFINQGKLLFYDTLDNVTARFSHGQRPVDVSLASRSLDAEVATKVENLAALVPGRAARWPATAALHVRGAWMRKRRS